MSRRVAVLAYHGAGFAGFQRQPAGRTVQGAFEEALGRFYAEPISIVAAGRTDAGVHALGQVAAWDPPREYPDEVLERALATLLPDDLRLVSCRVVPADFHPRYDALRREYRYLLREGDALLWRDRALILDETPDWSLMERAAARFVGTRDFGSFGGPVGGRGGTVRTVDECGLVHRPPLHWLRIGAEAFLYRMVRRIVGTLLRLGRRRWDGELLERLLAGEDPDRAPAAPAHGLYLYRVSYPGFAYRPDPGPLAQPGPLT